MLVVQLQLVHVAVMRWGLSAGCKLVCLSLPCLGSVRRVLVLGAAPRAASDGDILLPLRPRTCMTLVTRIYNTPIAGRY